MVKCIEPFEGITLGKQYKLYSKFDKYNMLDDELYYWIIDDNGLENGYIKKFFLSPESLRNDKLEFLLNE